MHDQHSPSPMQDSPDKGQHPAMVPYERFAEVNRQLKELRAAMGQADQTSPEMPEMTAEERAEAFFMQLASDPEGFLGDLMSQVVQKELGLLQEQMALDKALNTAKLKHPELQSFEGLILQEVMGILQSHPDVEKLSWEAILDKGFEQLQKRFKSALEQNPEEFIVDSREDVEKAFMEGNAPRKPQPLPPSFSRDEIAKMSIQEFLENESAIGEALKHKRIR